MQNAWLTCVKIGIGVMGVYNPRRDWVLFPAELLPDGGLTEIHRSRYRGDLVLILEGKTYVMSRVALELAIDRGDWEGVDNLVNIEKQIRAVGDRDAPWWAEKEKKPGAVAYFEGRRWD